MIWPRGPVRRAQGLEDRIGTRPGVTAPIIGATRMEHLDDAVAALAVTLDDADVTALEELYRPHAVLGHQ